MDKFVWVIERGSYSDYGVIGVFSSKENAEFIHAKLKERGLTELWDVDCWTLDPAVDEIRKGWLPFHIWMNRNGDVELIEQYEASSQYDANSFFVVTKPNGEVLSGTVWAEDEKHAVKIINEHRAMMIANGEWS